MKPTLLFNSRAPLALLALLAVSFQAGTARARRAAAGAGGKEPITTPKVADDETDGGLKEALLKGVAKSVLELIADEERNIRDNPAARTTALLRKIFGGGPRR